MWSNEGGQFDFLHRSVDDVGNLYETKDKKDRVYDAGSRLLETADATFSYDEEGNLIQKVEKKNGDIWQYEYFGNGMLAKVIKPDHTAVMFKYDALGRRVEKRSSEKTTTFIWDGHTIFHEYFSIDDSEKFENMSENSMQSTSERPANLITWVFNDGFVPSAKLTSEGNYSIISDYLGTPVEAYDEQGKKVWSADLDVYGRVHEFTGEQDFIPFRYQGQYEDVEIGLYYNRFRYYDPAQGNYTQVDPIGLAGGNPTLYGYVGDTNTSLDIFGLDIKYGSLDHLGRPTGVSATITSVMLNTGTSANQSIHPPGWDPTPGHGNARAHLLAKVLGGSGNDVRNLVTLTHNPINTPIMRGFEMSVRDVVKSGEKVLYEVIPIYNGDKPKPIGITIHAKGSKGFSLDVSIVHKCKQ